MSTPSLITLSDLDALKAPLIVDCRHALSDPQAGGWAFERGHIPGARHLHLEWDLSASLAPSGPLGPPGGRHPLPKPADFAETLRRHGLRQGQPVVAYDDVGGCYAARLWWMLRWLGHEQAAVLDGGLAAWTGAGRALETGPADAVQPGDWAPEPDPSRLVDFQQVAALPPDWTLVDCRAPERYSGEEEPLDPVAGHVPGALNRHWKDLLDDRGRLTGAPDLPPGPAVLYCGSGVTACVVALALEVGGHPYRLYPGSWSDWVARGGAVAVGPDRVGPDAEGA